MPRCARFAQVMIPAALAPFGQAGEQGPGAPGDAPKARGPLAPAAPAASRTLQTGRRPGDDPTPPRGAG